MPQVHLASIMFLTVLESGCEGEECLYKAYPDRSAPLPLYLLAFEVLGNLNLGVAGLSCLIPTKGSGT